MASSIFYYSEIGILGPKPNNEIKILSAALASTIKLLAGLGSLGKRLLKESGVTKIESDKEYLSQLCLELRIDKLKN